MGGKVGEMVWLPIKYRDIQGYFDWEKVKI
jgi:hypothetical protein